MKRARISAGLLTFRKHNGVLEVLLVHPGGPYFQNKDEGVWTIPKGEVSKGEDLLTRAKIEFAEEVGIKPSFGDFINLGQVKQKGGKIVHAWATEGNLPKDFKHASNTFEMEWPPRSGRRLKFPEMDRAEFFPLEKARQKIKPAQAAFLDRLRDALSLKSGG